MKEEDSKHTQREERRTETGGEGGVRRGETMGREKREKEKECRGDSEKRRRKG